MINSNNANRCEKCGTENPPIAKYCFQCGAHLKAPKYIELRDTPDVVDMGVRAQPQKEFGAKREQREGEFFRSDNQADNTDGVFAKTKSNKVRIFGGIIAFLSLLFVYFFLGVKKIFPVALYGTKMFGMIGSEGTFLSAFDILRVAFGKGFGGLLVGERVLTVLSLLFLLTAVGTLALGIVKICTGKQSKRAFRWCRFVFILGVVVVGVLAFPLLFADNVRLYADFATWLFGEGVSIEGGWMLWLSPVFFFVIYLFSLGVRKKKVKKKKHD